jgi:hypothetical protein
MRKHRSFYGPLALGAISGLVAVACTAGTGGLATFDDPHDRPPDSRDKPPDSRDKPPITGHETPPASLDNPGNHGGGPAAGGSSGGTAAACPPCDQKLDCQITTGTKTQKGSLTLSSDKGKCFAGDEKDDVTVECGGQILQNGNAIGTWAAANGGVTASITSASGQVTTLTCTPKASPTPPPTPTGTGTVKPPPIVDAGTKG